MKKIFKFSIMLLITTISCDKKKQTQVTTENIVSVTEKKIEINDLTYESLWNDVINEGEYDIVVGTYVKNRLGIANSALSMDGLSESVEVENHDNINPKNSITVSLWYKPISFKGNGNNYLVLKPYIENKAPFIQYALAVTGNEYPNPKARGVFKFSLSIGGKYYSIKTTPDTWTPNKWYNITGTYDGKYMKLLIDGEVKNNRTIEGDLDIYNTNLFIGKHENNKFFTPGIYDDFRVYDRALTIEEVLEIVN